MFAGRPRRPRPAPAWTRQKMLALLAGAALTAVALVCGLVLSVVFALHPPKPSTTRAPGGAPGRPGPAPARGPAVGGRGADARRAAQDALAARAMPTVDPEAFRPGPVSTRDPGRPIVLPVPTAMGPAGVTTGFPRTPAGAMAQLAAIDRAALQSGSLPAARAVIGAWALPGGPTASDWSGTAAMAALLNAAGLPGGGDPRLAVVLTPLMGQVKGTVGPGFVIPCVDFEADVTLTQTVRAADADCQRMVWTPAAPPGSTVTGDATGTSAAGGRWMVGPGPEPALPPAVWPDTDLAIAVGYHDLRQDTADG